MKYLKSGKVQVYRSEMRSQYRGLVKMLKKLESWSNTRGLNQHEIKWQKNLEIKREKISWAWVSGAESVIL